MDELRSCYYSHMRLYRDRPDVLTYGHWRFCPPGAVTTPTSVFFARRNELEDTDDRPLGEVYRRNYRYSKGLSEARLTGQHFCGSGDVWLNGNLLGETLPLDQGGVPVCCSAGPVPPVRLRINGQGARVRIGQGTLVLGSISPDVRGGGTVCGCRSVSSVTV